MAAVDEWEVVGGSSKGGIVVREGRDICSKEISGRLATGSVVRALETTDGRLRYEMLEGDGPAEGWVSTCMKGMDLLVRKSRREVSEKPTGVDIKDLLWMPENLKLENDVLPEQNENHANGVFLDEYAQRFARLVDEKVAGEEVNTSKFFWDVQPLLPDDRNAGERRPSQKQCLGKNGSKVDALNYPMFQPRTADPVAYMASAKQSTIASIASAKQKAKINSSTATEMNRPKSLEKSPFEPSVNLPSFGDRNLFASLSAGVFHRDQGVGNFKAISRESECVACMDGDTLGLCSQCKLPVGDIAYHASEDAKDIVHGECLAQIMLRRLNDEEEQQMRQNSAAKEALRLKYDIGWKVEQIPRNIGVRQQLKDLVASHGMCCLVLQENTKSVRLAATIEPSAAVNLEYLSIALQVRRKAGREPFFSLDPVDSKKAKDGALFDKLVKRFEPEWLAGTCVGEVLFQADYHLKELSMGEQEQPVVGMKSCFDYAEEKNLQKWNAREWFMVRQAEVLLSEDNVLVPRVKMGVEAREQILSARGLEDAPLTRRSHPMVKYAEAFTKNFDLIAERKSVIYHLREVAKAAVLAKFLVDADINMEETWFRLASEAEEACAMEIPQLWNERVHSKISVKDGIVDNIDKKIHTHGLYGGVSFGLDKFNIGQVAPSRHFVSPMASMSMVAPGAAVRFAPPAAPRLEQVSMDDYMVPEFTKDTPVFAGRMAASIAAVPSRAAMRPAAPVAVSAAPVPIPAARAAMPPPGVYPMSAAIPRMAAVRAAAPSSELRPPRLLGDFAQLRAGLAPPSEAKVEEAPEREKQVKAVAIVPTADAPALQTKFPTAPGIIQRLEARISPAVEAQGVDLNLDQFDLEAPQQRAAGNFVGALQTQTEASAMADSFWASVSNEEGSMFDKEDVALLKRVFDPKLSDRRTEGACFSLPDTSAAYVGKLRDLVKQEEEIRAKRKALFFSSVFEHDHPGQLFPSSWTSSLQIAPQNAIAPTSTLEATTTCEAEAEEIIRCSAATFAKKTEDGMHFRIYRMGRFEVRTVQEHNGEETIGAVFTTCEKSGRTSSGRSIGGHEKVRKITQYVEKAMTTGVSEDAQAPDAHYYVVLEAEHGSMVLTELLADGSVAWEENQTSLAMRNSLARVIRTANGQEGGAIMQEMKNYRAKAQDKFSAGTQLTCREYATGAYIAAVGGPQEALNSIADRRHKCIA